MRIELTPEEHENLEKYKNLLNTEIRNLKNRELNWTIYFYENLNIDFNKNTFFGCKDDFVHEICRHQDIREIINTLKKAREDSLISLRLTDWIKQDKRAQFFVFSIMKSNLNLNLLNHRFPTMIHINEPMDYTLLYLDIACLSTPNQHMTKTQEKEHKEIFVKNLQKTYSSILEAETYDEWLVYDDNQQIKWVKEYLVKQNALIKYEEYHDPKDDYALCLASLDIFGLSNYRPMFYPRPEKELFIKKMKAGWAQKKYRDAGKTKKPYHLPLNKKTKKMLSKVAAFHGEAENQILAKLIEEEYVKRNLNEF